MYALAALLVLVIVVVPTPAGRYASINPTNGRAKALESLSDESSKTDASSIPSECVQVLRTNAGWRLPEAPSFRLQAANWFAGSHGNSRPYS
jgi:hypothetical protein